MATDPQRAMMQGSPELSMLILTLGSAIVSRTLIGRVVLGRSFLGRVTHAATGGRPTA